MAFSVNTPVGDGVTKQFAVNFTNGLFSRDSVHAFVEGEVDGLGEPVERTFTWINDGLIELNGDAPGAGVVVNIRRIMDKDEPAVNFEDGEILTEATMDRSQDHLLNSIHELIDGYGFENVQTDMSLNGNSLVNVGNVEAESLTIGGIELTDSVDLARRWANEDEDVVVKDGRYSAKHFAIKAETAFDSLEPQFQEDQIRREVEFQASQDDREGVFNAYLVSAGYQFAGDYAAGIEITKYNQVVRDTYGELWRVSGSTPLPYTVTGAGLPEGGSFVAVGDAALRQELSLPVSGGNGALHVRGAVIYVDTISDLQALPTSELVDGQRVDVTEYHAGTGAGGGKFYWDAAIEKNEHNGGSVISPSVAWDGSFEGLPDFVQGVGESSSGFGAFRAIFEEEVAASRFGVVGDGDQTLYPTNYVTDRGNLSVIDQQTRDAICLNNAIVFSMAESKMLLIDSPIITTYGYFVPIEHDFRVRGLGIDKTVIKLCDSAPPDNGHGAWFFSDLVDDWKFVSVSNMIIDGNALLRGEPSGEKRAYNIVFDGKQYGEMFNVKSINSPIDCALWSVPIDDLSRFSVTDCIFSQSYRNTVTVGYGKNIIFTRCLIEGGGKIFGGTNPKYGLDIEPNNGNVPLENLQFISCTFRDCTNYLAGGVWCMGTRFSKCKFISDSDSPVGTHQYHVYFRGGEFVFDNCDFISPTYRGQCIFNDYARFNELYINQRIEIRGCSFHGVGVQGNSLDFIFKNSRILNSTFGLLLSNADARVWVSDSEFINCHVSDSLFGNACIFVTDGAGKSGKIENITVAFISELLPVDDSYFSSNGTAAYGIRIGSNFGGLRVIGCHVKGFNSDFKAHFTEYTGLTRNWSGGGNQPNAPQDSVGQTAESLFFRGCTDAY